MPAQRLTFTPENILSAWETVGIIPFNPRRALGGVKRKHQNVSHSKSSATLTTPAIPKTPRAVSRTTRTAFSLVTRTTPSSLKLKSLLSGLSEGFQQTIADKVVEEEAHRQYRQLVAKEKKGKTTDRRKLTAATVVTSEMVIKLREERERVDASKTARKANKLTRRDQNSERAQTRPPQQPAEAAEIAGAGQDSIASIAFNEAEDLWEEMEALEVSEDIWGEDSGGVVEETIQVLGRR